LRRSFQIGATYVGAVVGAGFASGQELIQFFLIFGSKGLWGLALSAVLFILFGMALLFLSGRCKGQSYQDIIIMLFGRKVGFIMDLWIILFLIAGMCIMLAGSGAIFSEHLGAPSTIGLALTAVCVVAALIGGGEGVMWINSLLIPFLVAVTLMVGISSLIYGETMITGDINLEISTGSLVIKNWVAASFLYVSYNLLIGMVILTSLERGHMKGDILGGLIGGLWLGLLAFVMGVAMLRFSNHIFFYEIPMLYLAERVHPLFKYFYTLVLWFSMLTTAVANAYGLTKRAGSLFAKCEFLNSRWAGIIIVLLVLPFTKLGFAHLVANIYPIFGYT